MPFRCYECGAVAKHAHHVVPEVLGGTRTVPLCHECHEKAHMCKIGRGELIRIGLAAARDRGVRLGRPGGPGKPLKLVPEVRDLVLRLKAEGRGISAIARAAKVSRKSVYLILGQQAEGRD